MRSELKTFAARLALPGRTCSPGTLLRDDRGAVMLLFGLSLPLILGAASAVTEYSSLVSRRSQLQNAADGAALSAARELTLAKADDRVTSVAKSVALATLAGNDKNGAPPAVTSQLLNERTAVEVVIRETRPVMMGHVLGVPTAI